MRPALAVLVAALVAALAGLMSGEQEMAVGYIPIVVGVLLGLGEAELVWTIWRGNGVAPRAVAAITAAAGTGWGVSIDADGGPVSATAWAGIVIALVVGALSLRRSASPAADTSSEP